MSRFLYDTAVFVYAVGRDHRYRDPCREIVRAARDGRLRGAASVELVHEYAHLLLRRHGDRPRAAREARAVWRLCALHEVTIEDLRRAVQLFEAHRLGGRDALHAATALNRGIPSILTPDCAFDEVPGLERVDPVDALARLA
ncbi:MAG: type II toxin-antitoxin system VapC family toxin [Egibacteraceae bacterium]